MVKKEKAYLIFNKTLRELEKYAQNSPLHVSTPIYKCSIDRNDLSDEQKAIQMRQVWLREKRINVNFADYRIDEMIEKFAYEEIENGRREKLQETIHKRIMDTEAKFFLIFGTNQAGRISIMQEFFIGNCDEDLEKLKLKEVDDMQEFEKKLREYKNYTGFSKSNEYVYLEELSVELYNLRFNILSKFVTKHISKFFRKNFTYCIKNDVVIVPEEYLARGEKGINEWRNMKKEKNKNNSMEKRILRRAINDKKEFAINALDLVAREICGVQSRRWDIPSIKIDGRFNKQKVAKLMAEINETTKRKQFMNMTNEEIVNRTKEYWKNILMEAYKRIDELKIGE